MFLRSQILSQLIVRIHVTFSTMNKQPDSYVNLVFAFAIISLIFNLFVQLTYQLDRDRFKYPLKAIIQMSFCYLIISIFYLVGYFLGDAIACDLDESKDKNTIFKTLSIDEKLSCKLSFVFINFFTIASLVWSIILIVTFYLEMVLMWANEIIENNNFNFHLIAFLSSALHTIVSVLNVNLQGDSISGICAIDLDRQFNYLILPEIVALAFNLIVLAITICCFFKIKQFLKLNKFNMKEFELFVFKLLVFLLIYLIAYAAQFLIFYFESHNFDLWIQQWFKTICDRDKDKCPNWITNLVIQTKPTFIFAAFKYLSYFLPSLASCTILFSSKTAKIWSSFF